MQTPQSNLMAAAVPSFEGLYSEYVNPQWVKLLNVLQMNVQYERCTAAELFTADGRRILDFLSGYCVHNAGHNQNGAGWEIVDENRCICDRRRPGGPGSSA